MFLSYRAANTTFRCGPQSPCECSVSKNDTDSLTVEFCPKKNSRMIISGIVAKKIYFQKAAIVEKYEDMEYIIANNTFYEIVDFRDDWRIQTQLFLLRVVFINNSNLILTDRRNEIGSRIYAIEFKEVIFCSYGVKKVIDIAFWTDNLTFYNLDQFSMNFSENVQGVPFVFLGTKNFLIYGKMSDIFLPTYMIYKIILFQNVESTSGTELLKDNFLRITMVENLVFQNSIHVTLPVSFPTGFNDKFWSSDYQTKLALDVWNMQKGTFSKHKLTLFKEINGNFMDNAKRNALSPDSNADLCSIFCNCRTTPPHNCSQCTNDLDKKTCAICVKNKAETSESAELFRRVCHLQNLSVINGPKSISDNPGFIRLSTIEESSTANELCSTSWKNDKQPTVSTGEKKLFAKNLFLFGAFIRNLADRDNHKFSS